MKADQAPVWIPRNETGYFVLTCTECVRSFSIAEDEACAPDAFDEEIHELDCVFCHAKVRYLLRCGSHFKQAILSERQHEPPQ